MNADYILIIYFTLLSKRKKVKRSMLAARAGVNVRTVSRCIDLLTLAGVPIYSEKGPDGGYYIPDDYVITQAAFSTEEKARIITCIKAVQQNFNDNLCDSVIDKLNSLSATDENYMIKSDTLVIDASDWNTHKHTSAKISALNRALAERKTVRMKYTNRYESLSERFIDPYTLVLKSGMWYIYGWCHAKNDFRLFKIVRIKDIVITEKTFERRPSNVYEKLHGEFDNRDLVQFTIEFDNLILPEIEEWLGLDKVEDTGAKYIAHAETFGGNQLIGKLMSFGSSVKVVSPAALREELEIECKRMLAIYND